jgi:antitoxin component YwqK of YwqJK toxin-antitoxin module
MKKLLTILLTLFLFSSVYAEVRVVENLEYRDGIAYAVGENGGFSGTWVNTGPNGKNKISELNYKDGLQDGLTTKWFPNGAKGEEANYKNGKLHGTATEWNINGAIESKTNYINGKLHGTATEWHTNGAIKSKTNYINGKDLKTTIYYKTGEVKSVWKFPDTSSTEYYKNGQVKWFTEYSKGSKLMKNYHEDGWLLRVEKYINGKLLEYTGYDKYGQVESFRDVNSSKATYYYKTGEIKTIHERRYRLSKTTDYYRSGEVQKVYEYDDKELSKTTDYYRSGEVQKVYEYENDGLFKRSAISKQTRYKKTGEIEKIRDFNNIPWFALEEIQVMIIYFISTLLLCLTLWRSSNTTTSSSVVLFTSRIIGFVALTPLIVWTVFSGGEANFGLFFWLIFAFPIILLWAIIEVRAMHKYGMSTGIKWVIISCFLIYFITNMFFILQWK